MRIVRDGRRFIVRDFGSRNGVLVNDASCRSAELEAAGQLRIGDAIFKFVEEDADELARYRIDGAMRDGESRTRAKPSALAGGYASTPYRRNRGVARRRSADRARPQRHRQRSHRQRATSPERPARQAGRHHCTALRRI